MERTLVLIKPDAIQRGLTGAILARLEARGLKIAGLRMLHMDEALARVLCLQRRRRPAVVYRNYDAGIPFRPEPATVGEVGRSQRNNSANRRDSNRCRRLADQASSNQRTPKMKKNAENS